jgi:hypothetical protein
MQKASNEVNEIEGFRKGNFVTRKLNADGIVGVVCGLHSDSTDKIEVRFVENQSTPFEPGGLIMVDDKDSPPSAVELKGKLGL